MTDPTIAIPAADLAELIAAAAECADDLDAHIEAEYPVIERTTYAIQARRYNRDMTPVRRLRAAVAKVQGKESGQ